MIKNFKIKVLITVLLILTISLISTSSNAAMKFNTDFFTNLKTKLSESFSQAITRGKEVLEKLKEGFDIGLERTETGIRLNLGLDYSDAGEYFAITTGNAGIVEFDMSTMTLKATGFGETVMYVKIGEKVIPIDIKITKSGIELKPEGLGTTVNGDLVGYFKLNEKEIANIEANMEAEGGVAGAGLSGTVTGTQNLTLLQKLKLNFKEIADGKVDMSGASGSVGGSATIGENTGVSGQVGAGVNMSGVVGTADGGVIMNGEEVVGGNAGLGYEFGAADPVASVSGRVLGNSILNLKNITIPVSKVISGLRMMLSTIKLPF